MARTFVFQTFLNVANLSYLVSNTGNSLTSFFCPIHPDIALPCFGETFQPVRHLRHQDFLKICLNGHEGNVLLCSCLCQKLESYLVASVQYPCSCQLYDFLENFEQLPQNLTS